MYVTQMTVNELSEYLANDDQIPYSITNTHRVS